jgi:hypothetical protein
MTSGVLTSFTDVQGSGPNDVYAVGGPCRPRQYRRHLRPSLLRAVGECSRNNWGAEGTANNPGPTRMISSPGDEIQDLLTWPGARLLQFQPWNVLATTQTAGEKVR